MSDVPLGKRESVGSPIELLEAAQAFRLALMVLVSKIQDDDEITNFLSEHQEYLDSKEAVINQWSEQLLSD
ncbi:MAG: hypothetical protein AAGJ68_03375 [Pseudomonadota bacterium]